MTLVLGAPLATIWHAHDSLKAIAVVVDGRALDAAAGLTRVAHEPRRMEHEGKDDEEAKRKHE